jgi:hypothetical protein
MRSFVLVWVSFCLLADVATSQGGYNFIYDQGYSHKIHAINYGANDKLYISGIINTSDSTFQGVFVAAMDTLGNVVYWKNILDPDTTAILATSKETGMTTTDKDLTILPLNFLGRNSIGVAIVRADSVMLKEYPQDTLLVMIPHDIIECPGGFLLCGDAQMLDYNVDAAVMKIDERGSVLWARTYGHPVHWEGTRTIIAKDSDTYVVSGARYQWDRDPIFSHGWVLAIDSLGNKLWEWEANENERPNEAIRSIQYNSSNK